MQFVFPSNIFPIFALSILIFGTREFWDMLIQNMPSVLQYEACVFILCWLQKSEIHFYQDIVTVTKITKFTGIIEYKWKKNVKKTKIISDKQISTLPGTVFP